MAGVIATDYLQFRDMNLPLCLIHYFILLTLARLVWGLHQPSPERAVLLKAKQGYKIKNSAKR